jgi:hypothetical protein
MCGVQVIKSFSTRFSDPRKFYGKNFGGKRLGPVNKGPR